MVELFNAKNGTWVSPMHDLEVESASNGLQYIHKLTSQQQFKALSYYHKGILLDHLYTLLVHLVIYFSMLIHGFNIL
jgi:hypothetical protein